MNSIAGTMPDAPVRNPLDGVEEEIDKRRRQSRDSIGKAASELGDEPEYYVSFGDLNQDFVMDFYKQVRAEDMATIKKLLMLLAACGTALILDIFYVKSALGGDAATRLTALGIVLVPILGLSSFCLLLASIFKSFFGWGSTADYISLFGDKAAAMWGVGSKAIYAVSNDELQVVRLDSVGSVELQEDGRLVVSSRFGDSSVSFWEARADRMTADEIAEDLRRRIH
jgi:hypothetical protein